MFISKPVSLAGTEFPPLDPVEIDDALRRAEREKIERAFQTRKAVERVTPSFGKRVKNEVSIILGATKRVTPTYRKG